MDKRLRDIIHTLDYYELLKIKKDLRSGGQHLLDFIEHEITRREQDHHVFCTSCGSEIQHNASSVLTLVFGPHDFRKKATFCGKDCLDYFMAKMDASQRKQNAVQKVP